MKSKMAEIKNCTNDAINLPYMIPNWCFVVVWVVWEQNYFELWDLFLIPKKCILSLARANKKQKTEDKIQDGGR